MCVFRSSRVCVVEDLLKAPFEDLHPKPFVPINAIVDHCPFLLFPDPLWIDRRVRVWRRWGIGRRSSSNNSIGIQWRRKTGRRYPNRHRRVCTWRDSEARTNAFFVVLFTWGQSDRWFRWVRNDYVATRNLQHYKEANRESASQSPHSLESWSTVT